MARKASIREDGPDLCVEVDLRIAGRLSPCGLGANHNQQAYNQQAYAERAVGPKVKAGPNRVIRIDPRMEVGRRTFFCEREKPNHGNLFFAGAVRGRDETRSKGIRICIPILFGMVPGVSVGFSKRRISLVQNREIDGNVTSANRRFPDRTESGKIA